jgi:hypothetical protein
MSGIARLGFNNTTGSDVFIPYSSIDSAGQVTYDAGSVDLRPPILKLHTIFMYSHVNYNSFEDIYFPCILLHQPKLIRIGAAFAYIDRLYL